MADYRNPSQDPVSSSRKGGAGWIAGIIAVIAVILIALAIWEPGDGRQDLSTATQPAAVPGTIEQPGATDERIGAGGVRAGAVSVDDVVSNPGTYAGQTVRVSGQVEQVISPNAFRLSTGGAIAASSLLVVMSNEVAETVTEKSFVVVDGDVAMFSPALAQQRTGAPFDAETFGGTEDTPMIIASNITVQSVPESGAERLPGVPSGGSDQESEDDGSEMGAMGDRRGSTGSDEPFIGGGTDEDLAPQAPPAPLGGPQVLTENDNVADQPQSYMGRAVVLHGSIDRLIGTNALVVSHGGIVGGGDLLVISRARNLGGNLTENTSVEIRGMVREFNREALQRELGYELSPQLFSAYEQRGVIIADSVTQSEENE